MKNTPILAILVFLLTITSNNGFAVLRLSSEKACNSLGYEKKSTDASRTPSAQELLSSPAQQESAASSSNNNEARASAEVLTPRFFAAKAILPRQGQRGSSDKFVDRLETSRNYEKIEVSGASPKLPAGHRGEAARFRETSASSRPNSHPRVVPEMSCLAGRTRQSFR